MIDKQRVHGWVIMSLQDSHVMFILNKEWKEWREAWQNVEILILGTEGMYPINLSVKGSQ